MLDEGAESLNLPHKITPGNSLLVANTKQEHEEEEKGIFSLKSVFVWEGKRMCPIWAVAFDSDLTQQWDSGQRTSGAHQSDWLLLYMGAGTKQDEGKKGQL